jgi:uncharacterized repeat protein (TIGR01451 family)
MNLVGETPVFKERFYMTVRFRFILLLLLVWLFAGPAAAEQHRATRLGDPETRFAPTMVTPDDLRERFQDAALRPDFIEVLRQWGWPGKLDDFFNAGLTNETVEMEIPVGSVMPFMSTRRDGNAICLRNVIWAGQEPISAYAFTFNSNGRRYRCIIPKPCSNFFVVDEGPEPKVTLKLDCHVPPKIMAGHDFEIVINVHNSGNIIASNAMVTLPIPENVAATATTDGGLANSNSVQWQLMDLPVNATKQIRARFKPDQAGTIVFEPRASNGNDVPVTGSCAITVGGIPAILFENTDEPDPVPLGGTTTYTVKITNQGTADVLNLQVIATIANELIPVGASEGSINNQGVIFPVLPKLGARKTMVYTIIAKGVKTGNGRTRFDLSADTLKRPLYTEESTTVY